MVWKVCGIVASLAMLAFTIMCYTMGYCGGVLECGTSSVPMHCYYAYQAAMGIGVGGFACGLVGLTQKDASARRIAALAICVCVLVALAVLWVLVGVCANASMSCNVNRLPISGVAAVAMVAAIVGAIKANDAIAAAPKAKL